MTLYVGIRTFSGNASAKSAPIQAVDTPAPSGPSGGYASAVAAAQASSNAVMSRGAGPVMGSASGKIGTASYALTYGAFGGGVWFSDDTNHDGVADTDAQLNSYWQFDPSSPVQAGHVDFYSVALREMLRTLGFGLGDSWAALAQGTSWNGSHVDALFGGGTSNLITADGHVAAGLQGARLSDGQMQEAALSATLQPGVRKTLTTLDAAFLQDVGYAVIPEPHGWVWLLSSALCAAAWRCRSASPCASIGVAYRRPVASTPSPRRRLYACAFCCLGTLLPCVAPAQTPNPFGVPVPPGEENPTLAGPAGVKTLPIQRAKGAAGTLVFVHGPNGGSYGQYTRVNVSAAPGAAGAPADVSYDRFLGPLTMKSLGQVMKAMVFMEKGWPQGQKIQFSFIHKPSPSELVPATLAAGLALDSMLRNYDIELSYAAVGSLQEDGSIGPVGGIPERLAGAARAQVARIVVPDKNQEQVADYLLSEGVAAFVGTQIFSVSNFNEAGVLSLTSAKLRPETAEAWKLFGSVQRTFAVKTGDAVPMLRSEPVQALLRKVLEAAPNHCSAQVLLDWATGKHTQITFDGSVDLIDRRGADLIQALRAQPTDALKSPKEKVAAGVAALRFAVERMDPRTRPYASALIRFGETLEPNLGAGASSKPPRVSALSGTALETARQQGNDEWTKMAKIRQAMPAEPK